MSLGGKGPGANIGLGVGTGVDGPKELPQASDNIAKVRHTTIIRLGRNKANFRFEKNCFLGMIYLRPSQGLGVTVGVTVGADVGADVEVADGELVGEEVGVADGTLVGEDVPVAGAVAGV